MHKKTFDRMCFPDGSVSKESACNAGDPVQFLGWEDPVEREMATHSSILAWRIPWDHYIVPGVTKRRTQLSNFHFTSLLLYCTPQAHKSCSCPALGPTKSLETVTETCRVYWTRGSYTKSWGDSPMCTADGRQDVTEAFTTQGRRMLPSIRGIDIRWAHQLPGPTMLIIKRIG